MKIDTLQISAMNYGFCSAVMTCTQAPITFSSFMTPHTHTMKHFDNPFCQLWILLDLSTFFDGPVRLFLSVLGPFFVHFRFIFVSLKCHLRFIFVPILGPFLVNVRSTVSSFKVHFGSVYFLSHIYMGLIPPVGILKSTSSSF